LCPNEISSVISYCNVGMVAIELDVEYDKKVLREVLIAGDDAKVADIVKAPFFVKPDEK
jgi:hypothetical protein